MYVQTVVMPCRSGLCRRGTKYSHIYIYIYIWGCGWPSTELMTMISGVKSWKQRHSYRAHYMMMTIGSIMVSCSMTDWPCMKIETDVIFFQNRIEIDKQWKSEIVTALTNQRSPISFSVLILLYVE